MLCYEQGISMYFSVFADLTKHQAKLRCYITTFILFNQMQEDRSLTLIDYITKIRFQTLYLSSLYMQIRT